MVIVIGTIVHSGYFCSVISIPYTPDRQFRFRHKLYLDYVCFLNKYTVLKSVGAKLFNID